MSKENLNDILEEKFMTAAKFSMEIENLMKISNGTMNYIECIIHYCTENNIEIETHLINNCDHNIPIKASSIALNYILKKI